MWRRQASLAFEAAVGGGIPCIRVFQHALLSDKFHRVSGILNGTTNFMLSAMESRGVSYADILKEAQDAGFAEGTCILFPFVRVAVVGW